MKVRVLHLLPGLKAGGAERQVCGLALASLERDDVTTAVATMSGGGQLAKTLTGKVQLFDLGRGARDVPGAGRPLREAAGRFRPDVLNAHLTWPFYAAAMALRGWETPALVYTVHSISNRRRRIPLLKPLDTRVSRQYSRATAVSAEAKRRFVGWTGYDESRTDVVANGVDLGCYRPSVRRERAEVTIVFPARLQAPKDHATAIEAARLLVARGVGNFVITASGEGPLYGRLKQRVSKLGLDERFRVAGPCLDMAGAYERADIFLLSSRREGLSVSLLEGMACGLPVVASRVPGVEEVCPTQDEGALLVPGGSPAAMADALERLIRSPQLRLELGRRARLRVEEEFSIERSLEGYLDSYRRALSAG